MKNLSSAVNLPTAELRGIRVKIKEAGKWEVVSDLNVHTLAKVMGRCSPELVEKISKFARMEESCRIYVSSLKETTD